MDEPVCSFCGYQNVSGDGVKLFLGPGVNICQHCVAEAAGEMARAEPFKGKDDGESRKTS